jgi:hypothetical protein
MRLLLRAVATTALVALAAARPSVAGVQIDFTTKSGYLGYSSTYGSMGVAVTAYGLLSNQTAPRPRSRSSTRPSSGASRPARGRAGWASPPTPSARSTS